MADKVFKIEDGGKEVELEIKLPLPDDLEEAEMARMTKVASLIRQNANKRLLLKNDLDRFLRETNVWTEKDEEDVKRLNKEIDELLSQLRRGGLKLSEGREIAIKTMDKRKEIVNIMHKRSAFDDLTVESVGDNERNDYLIYCAIVYKKDGRRYWDSFEDMKNDKLSEAYRKGSVLAIEAIYNINTEFEKNLPENKWLKKYNFINDDLNYVDRKTGEKVDKTGRPVVELEKEVQREFDNLQGEIIEEVPFIDDETGSQVVVG